MAKKFIGELLKHKKLGLISHVSPDGDAIGSQVALYHWLTGQGVDALLFNDDSVPSNLEWIEGSRHITVPEEKLLEKCDAFVFIDGNHPIRFGNSRDWFESTEKPIYLIDHHLDPRGDFFSAMWWNPKASSAAYLVYQIFEATGLEGLNRSAAEAIYSGIVTDTGSFRFPTVTAETHYAIGKIIEAGNLNTAEIHQRIYDDKSVSDYHLLGLALNNIELHCDGRLATMYITHEMLEQTGTSYQDIEGLVNYPLSIRGVEVSVMFSERDDRIKISLRGKSVVDLNQFSRKFEGGGHFNAAGARHPGPMKEAIQDMVSEMKRSHF